MPSTIDIQQINRPLTTHTSSYHCYQSEKQSRRWAEGQVPSETDGQGLTLPPLPGEKAHCCVVCLLFARLVMVAVSSAVILFPWRWIGQNRIVSGGLIIFTMSINNTISSSSPSSSLRQPQSSVYLKHPILCWMLAISLNHCLLNILPKPKIGEKERLGICKILTEMLSAPVSPVSLPVAGLFPSRQKV